MKSKFFNLINVYLATSILLVPAQKVFGFSANSQAVIPKTQHLIHNKASYQKAAEAQTQNLGQVQEANTPTNQQSYPARFVATSSQTSASSLSSSADQTVQISHTAEEVFVTVFFISYVLVGLQYRKHRRHRAAVLLQQIETLERIWKMNPQQR